MGLKIKDISRSVLAPVQNRFLQQNNTDRIYDFGSNFGANVINITFHVKGQTTKIGLQNILRAAAAWLFPLDKQAKKLELDQDGGLYYMAKVDGSTDLTEILSYGYFTVSFICLIPYKIGASVTVATPNSGVNVININNIGTAEAPMIITVNQYASWVSQKITNQEGKYVKVDGVIENGLWVYDTEKESVTFNGANKMNLLDITSRFFKLKVGANTFTYTPTYGVFSIQYSPRYL